MRRREFMASLATTAVYLGLNPGTVWSADAVRPKIGILAPLSGTYRSLGRTVVDAARLAAQEQAVELLVEDTKAEPEEALKAVTRLVEARVHIAIGPVGVRESVTAAGWALRKNLPLIALCSDPSLHAGPLTLRWRLSPDDQARQLAAMLPGQRAAILYPDTDYGRGAALGFQEAWTTGKKPRELVRLSAYPDEKPDLRRALDALTGTREFIGPGNEKSNKKADKLGYITTGQPRRVDFDTLFIPDFHQRVTRILAYLPTVGIQNGEGGNGVAVQLAGLAGWRGKSMELTGAQAAGTLILDTYAGIDDGGRAEEFDRAFEAATGRLATSFEAEVFDAVWLAANAVRANPAAPLTALNNSLPFTGVAGEIQRTAEGIQRQGRLFRFDVDGRVIPLT